MKKLFVLFVFLCILLTGCNTETRYFFSKDTCSIRAISIPHLGATFDNPDEREQSIRVDKSGTPKPHGIIAQCTVLDGSTNHIDPGLTYYSHVRTPIVIDKIFYAGSDVTLSEGDSFVVIEPYWYETTEDGTVVTDSSGKQSCLSLQEYNPLVAGKTYILYMYITVLSSVNNRVYEEFHDCGGDLIWKISANTYSAYPVCTREEAEDLLVTTNDAYWEIWEYVMKTYKA